MRPSEQTEAGGHRDDWVRISNHIARCLAHDAKSWFEHVLQEVTKAGPEDSSLKVVPARTSLDGDAILAITAFQLIAATRFIGTLRYIAEPDGRDFADLMWARVCGDRLDEVIARVRYYQEVKDDQEALWSRFATNVMEHILGEESPFLLVLSVVMQTTFPELIGHVGSIVADAFDDEETFNDLQRQMRNMRQ
jgi:hypothetical protein